MTATTPPQQDVEPREALRRLFGYPDFRPGQEEIVGGVLAGEDLLAVMPTGAGKSLCYQLPAMLLPGCTVVISPLVALMKDQLDSLPPALREQAAVFNSTVEREEMDARTADLVSGQVKLVYVAPERLRQRPFLHALARAAISRFVVDEAHCISLWGHDFRPDYLFIPAVVEMLGNPPVLAMTATATKALQAELGERFHRPLRVIHTGVLRPNLLLEVERVRDAEEKLRRLIDLCTDTRGTGIVYVSSRERAEQVAAVLRRHGISARHYHAGMDTGDRAAVQDAFMRGRVRVIVATVAFGMGVDKPDVRFIVHFNPSRSLEAYAQESGRAGRDGVPARCILFWASSDKAALARWAREDALTPDLLRAVYRGIRQRATGNGQRGGNFVRWPLARLVEIVKETLAGGGTTKTDDVDETAVRVAIGALEQVEVLRRHCDLPETVRVRALGEARPHPPDPPLPRGERGEPGPRPMSNAQPSPAARAAWEDLARNPVAAPPSPLVGEGGRGGEGVLAALGAEPGERLSLDPFEIADALGCPPSDVEERLLLAQDEGALAFQGFGRGMLLELLPHPPDLAERLRALLDGYERAQLRRIEEIMAYATRPVCRTATIARHFGVSHPGRCGNCDVCRGGQRATGNGQRGEDAGQRGAGGRERERPGADGRTADASRSSDEPALPERAPEDIIIACVAELPFPMGRAGVSKLLKGSVASAVQADRSRHFGMLAGMTISAIQDQIDRLVEAGYLNRDTSEYRLLSVTPAGFAKEPAPWPPVAPPTPGPRPLRASAASRERGDGSRDRAPTSTSADRVSVVLTGLPTFGEDDPRVEERFERLRTWRLQESRRSNLSPAYVFPNETLHLLASTHVTSLDDLSRIKGIGPSKLERYGEALLALLEDDSD